MDTFEERRERNRPASGARKACPACGGVMRFFERYTVQHGTDKKIEPAWVCGCGHELYVRKPQPAKADLPARHKAVS